MDVTTGQWVLGAIGALLVGLAKGGIPGVGNLTVIIFAEVFDARASVGLLLPVLIAADIVAVTVYRRHVAWDVMGRLLPWMIGGILVGYGAFRFITSEQVKLLIGVVVLGMTGLQIFRSWQKQRQGAAFADRMPHALGFRAGMGLLGGFATMVANAAGPVGQIYFLAMGLKKMAFIGTAAWVFFLVNLFKVPLQAHLGIINFDSLPVSASLMPFAALGALIAPQLVRFIPQRQFEGLIWCFIVVAGLKMLFF